MPWQNESHENMNTKFDQWNLLKKSTLLIRTCIPSEEEKEVTTFLHSLTSLSILLCEFQVNGKREN